MPVNVSVPEPEFVREPVPETTPEYVSVSDLSNARLEFATMLEVATEPVVEPAPIFSVPSEIVSAPVKVFAPESVSEPCPYFVRPYDPEIGPEIVAAVSPIWILESAAIVTVPDNVPAAPKKIAPLLA